MFRRESGHEQADAGLAFWPTLLAARWTAYGLMLTAGLVLLSVVPHDTPVAPLTSHGHMAQTVQGPATVSWVPTLREDAHPELAPPEVAVRLHMARAHHEMRTIRVSPHQLSLGKW